MLDFIILVEACFKKKVDIYIFINNLLYGEVIQNMRRLDTAVSGKKAELKLKNMQSIRVNNFSCPDL